MKKREHWSRHILFLAPVTLFVIVLLLVLMFFTCKFAMFLYTEFLILIDTVGKMQ